MLLNTCSVTVLFYWLNINLKLKIRKYNTYINDICGNYLLGNNINALRYELTLNIVSNNTETNGINHESYIIYCKIQ